MIYRVRLDNGYRSECFDFKNGVKGINSAERAALDLMKLLVAGFNPDESYSSGMKTVLEVIFEDGDEDEKETMEVF